MVDAVQLVRNVDGLRAMFYALAAADAVAGLAQFGYAAVVADKECPAGFAVVAVLPAGGEVAFIDAFVVMQQYCGDVDAVGAGHAVLAVVAGDSGILVYLACCIFEECLVLIGQRH